MLEYTPEGEKMTNPSVVNYLPLDPIANVVFDKKTDKFRIFVYNYFETGLYKNLNRLTILDEDLKEVLVADIPGICLISKVKPIHPDFLIIIGYTEFPTSNLRKDEGFGHLRRSLVLNLPELKLHELATPDGQSFEDSCSYFQDRIFGLKRENRTLDTEKSQTGIYLSDVLL